ncbi:DnaD domain-containing protein [Bacillus sp. AFS073361]|uniref:DnaD domain-containing protein n=1 Tax=Bacillus sp. AFS073361 TaxID=2033511 RepID=UPI00211D523D|nr:DnaD domain protein [Bacillus sp. AFS073361]
MAKYRMVRTDFWKNPMVSEEMSPEDKYFYLYLLTNPETTQIGIYKITKKQMAFDLGYSIESVHALMERFTDLHKLIRYNPETRELAIKDWARNNLHKGGKPIMDCIYSELKEVVDTSLIRYVSESILKEEMRSLFDSFCGQDELLFNGEYRGQDESYPYIEEDDEMLDDSFSSRYTVRGQKENENKNKNKKQQESFQPNIVENPDSELPSRTNQKEVVVKEIVEFWDNNGFGFTNINAKQQLLIWFDDSSFLQPKEIILKAMNIACASNKRKLNYVVGILKNWENENLLTVEEIDSYQEKQRPVQRQSTAPFSSGRDIPRGINLDFTAGEEE